MKILNSKYQQKIYLNRSWTTKEEATLTIMTI